MNIKLFVVVLFIIVICRKDIRKLTIKKQMYWLFKFNADVCS
jgi:hypothetical protein